MHTWPPWAEHDEAVGTIPLDITGTGGGWTQSNNPLLNQGMPAGMMGGGLLNIGGGLLNLGTDFLSGAKDFLGTDFGTPALDLLGTGLGAGKDLLGSLPGFGIQNLPIMGGLDKLFGGLEGITGFAKDPIGSLAGGAGDFMKDMLPFLMIFMLMGKGSGGMSKILPMMLMMGMFAKK